MKMDRWIENAPFIKATVTYASRRGVVNRRRVVDACRTTVATCLFGIAGSIFVNADEPPEQQAIRQMLQSTQNHPSHGSSETSNPPPPLTDDPSILGGIAEIIRDNGSLLRGSELDKPLPDRLPSVSPDQTPNDSGQSGSDPVKPDPTTLPDRECFEIAEDLLSLSRRLEDRSPGDLATRQLVNQMRFAAVNLLSGR